MGTELMDKTLLSPRATELLECFSEEWEEFVYQLAKHIATQEGSFGDAERQIPLVQEKHVKEAAYLLLQEMKNAMERGVFLDLPTDERSRLLATLSGAMECLESKFQGKD